MTDRIARFYVADNNPDGAFIFGAPHRDITETEWAGYAPHIQRSVDASAMYRKTKPPKAVKTTPPPAASEPEMPAPDAGKEE